MKEEGRLENEGGRVRRGDQLLDGLARALPHAR